MREILFRGKRVGNGEWVEGGYYENNTGKYIISPAFVAHLIIPETVGQYTGLTDMNGRKIFEGDIVKYDKELHPVVYEPDEGMFELRSDEFVADFSCMDSLIFCEVVGNIHDNPELLELLGVGE